MVLPIAGQKEICASANDQALLTNMCAVSIGVLGMPTQKNSEHSSLNPFKDKDP